MRSRHQEFLLEALLFQGWGLVLDSVREDILLAGSPERCLWRSVVETQTGNRLVLEEIAPSALSRKREIALVLRHLSDRGLAAIHPYLRSLQGPFIYSMGDRHWQVRPYLEGIDLKRPDCVFDARIGKALADFLNDFMKKGKDLSHSSRMRPFSIKTFIYDLLCRIETHRMDLLTRLRPIVHHLEADFMKAHDQFATSFCHGDYHPLNVIWSETGIVSVIDWEFCGYKPEAYDLALLMGCIGMEDPEALLGPLVETLLSEVKSAFTQYSLGYLTDLVMAVRFAWLSEWLRNQDEAMVVLECDYLELLLREREVLEGFWFGK